MLETINADNSGARATVAILLVSGAALLGAALIAASALHLPALGRVGFAILSAIVLGLGGLRVSRLHFVTDDESEEWREAEQTMVTSVELLQQRGISAMGSVGTDKPLESMADALGFFPATRVLLATPPEEESYWPERGLQTKARALATVPVLQVVVTSSARGDHKRRV